MRRFAAVLAVVLAVAGCASSGHVVSLDGRHRPTRSPSPRPTRTVTPTGSPTGGPIVYPTHCVARDGNELPDPTCTPGALNPAVTQATINSTICVKGWTATVRPPLSYTSKVKGLAIKAYGDYAGASFGAYELDHLIPLELGGAPWDVRNLFSETPASPNPKDNVEYAANRAVCSGRMPLATAQAAIATNWIALGHQLHVPGIPAS